jgi:hypothetical protein
MRIVQKAKRKVKQIHRMRFFGHGTYDVVQQDGTSGTITHPCCPLSWETPASSGTTILLEGRRNAQRRHQNPAVWWNP